MYIIKLCIVDSVLCDTVMETAWKLYLSRALTAWGDRLWAFGLGLLVFRLYPQNLTLVAAFGLVRSFVSIALGASVGNWIDGVQRLRAARAFVLVKNLFVAANCLIFAAYYQLSFKRRVPKDLLCSDHLVESFYGR